MTEINAEYPSKCEALYGELSSGKVIHGELVPGGIVSEDYPPYTGDYIVTPSVEEQKLGTRQKLLTKDLTIEKIPYSEVSNVANGITATIG